MPTIYVSRQQWGAREADHELAQLDHDAQVGLAVHHSGSKDEQRDHHGECAGVVRAIQRFHMDERGWDDIAYSWLSCTHGYLFEGRGIGRRTAAQGTGPGNAHWHAVCWLGDGDDFTRTANNVLPLQTARSLVLSRYPHAVDVWPHLRFHPDTCPGEALREWCRQFPDLVAGP